MAATAVMGITGTLGSHGESRGILTFDSALRGAYNGGTDQNGVLKIEPPDNNATDFTSKP